MFVCKMCIYDSSNSVDSFSSEFGFSLDIWCDYRFLFLSSLLRFGPIFYKHWIYVPTAESILECVTLVGFTKHFDKLFMWVKGVKCTQTHTLVDLSISKTWFDVMTVVTRFKSIHRSNGRQRFHLSNPMYRATISTKFSKWIFNWLLLNWCDNSKQHMSAHTNCGCFKVTALQILIIFNISNQVI